jgi:hypothetical protein
MLCSTSQTFRRAGRYQLSVLDEAGRPWPNFSVQNWLQLRSLSAARRHYRGEVLAHAF